jgi:ribosomal protein L7/L12
MDLSNIIIIAVLVIILPLLLIHVLSRRYREDAKILLGARSLTSKTTATSVDRDMLSEEVKELLANGRKIDAIKLVREKTRFSLGAAKEMVETMERVASPAAHERTMAETLQIARELAPEVRRLVKQGQRLEAVKLIRKRTGMGLREAKEMVDKLG